LNEEALVRLAFGSTLHRPTAAETQTSHDIRVPGNVAVESTNGITFVYNGEIAEDILFKGKPLHREVFGALGKPELVVIFCHYDSGGSFGYAVIRNGVTIRSRVQTMGRTTDEGTPNECELPWLQAEKFTEEVGEPSACRNVATGEVTSEDYLTARLLTQIMIAFFGLAPWDEWDYKTKFNHYVRLAPEELDESSAVKAWWKFW
jgi:hypothetical protein